ncbi:MAG: Glutaredoxin [Methanoregula sp. PtaU1.Bin051]|nr:MAG: Glutaredoxin [Methanoregula sp. PtaU1.Bin051]
MTQHPQLIVYSLDCCPNCDKLKTYLTTNGVAYSERDLSSAEALTELRVNGVFVNEAPVLQKGDNFMTTSDLFSSGTVNGVKVSQFIAGE